ncbi:MAG TPA: glycosyltransferase family 87 protein [Chloroflexia bacterium]|nr:glycosyltransferase family 87 protein [Chloroflexia bacterium]
MEKSRLALNPYLLLVPLLLVYIGSAVYIQYLLNPTFYIDQRIYQDAGAKAVLGQNPYLPFSIPATYVYPPAILPLFAGLNMLPFDLARIIWIDINILVYLSSLLVSWLWLKPAASFRNLLIFGLMLFYGPLFENITIGQVDCLVLLGLVLFVRSAGQPRYRALGGLGLALATLIKFTPGMLLIALLWQCRWRSIGYVVLFGLVLASVSLLMFGAGPWWDYFQLVPRLITSGSSDPNNQRITTSLAWFLNSSEANETVRLVGSLFSVLMVSAWLVTLVWPRRKPELEPVLLLGIVVLTISSSLIWYHHFLFLIIPLLYLLVKYEQHWLAWIGWGGLAAIQLDRVVEHAFRWPPVITVAGYLLLFGGMLVVNWLPGLKGRELNQPDYSPAESARSGFNSRKEAA